MPALAAIFSKEVLMVLVWGVVLVALGFAIQVIALIKTKAIPRWQGVFLLFFGGPDGFEIVNLIASILMAVALVPYGIKLIKGDYS
jgi:hypothetical protein